MLGERRLLQVLFHAKSLLPEWTSNGKPTRLAFKFGGGLQKLQSVEPPIWITEPH